MLKVGSQAEREAPGLQDEEQVGGFWQRSNPSGLQLFFEFADPARLTCSPESQFGLRRRSWWWEPLMPTCISDGPKGPWDILRPANWGERDFE